VDLFLTEKKREQEIRGGEEGGEGIDRKGKTGKPTGKKRQRVRANCGREQGEILFPILKKRGKLKRT